jgi:multidrug resistance efflux pump
MLSSFFANERRKKFPRRFFTMNHKRPPVPAIVILILLVAVSAYFIYTQSLEDKNGALTASGFIEATQVDIAPELAGKVTEVLVDEGQAVKAGDPLLRLDPSLLTAQRAVAATQVDSAKAALGSANLQYALAIQTAQSAQGTATAKNWRFSAPDEFNQPAWYFDQYEQLEAANAEAVAAEEALEMALSNLDKVIADLNNADFLNAEARLANARAAFLVADQVKTNADYAAEGGGLQAAADEAYNAALDELNAAQIEYNALLDTDSAKAVLDARGKLAVAQARYDAAVARAFSLQTGMDSPSVVTAKQAVEQAKTILAQAEANLALLDTQIAKLTIIAPSDGVVLTRNVEPGEFVQPGATAFVIGQLNSLTITVFVPEDRYGELRLGQTATVTVDSFPGVTFTASIVNISDKAEFTPRNVQTVEGRSSTVYAIKLSVTDPDGKLKIGMPADVVFSNQ